uniref:uncharacterized protein LOC117603964 n=1 Tax=Osmia lignaria TaxID=473952 RepID=UPI001478A574|nr:uncharacterized protein LOC117603964 [Osmia lignaria]
MDTRSYTDFSIAFATYLTKYTGIWVARNAAEELQRKISMSYTAVALVYGIYLNVVDIYHTWGDATHCTFLILNATCLVTTIIKMIILNSKRAGFADALFCAKQHFWHGNYDSEERLIFSISVKYCTLYVVFVICSLQIALSGYVITPIIENIGRNKSDRVLPFKLWVNLPLTETPYFELAFASQITLLLLLNEVFMIILIWLTVKRRWAHTFNDHPMFLRLLYHLFNIVLVQVISVYLIGAAYICPETFLCVFNLHVMGQFRILQHRMLNFCNVESKEMNADTYTDHCYAALKKCIKHHQLLIEFCEKLEHVYTMSIFTHMVVLSLLLCFDAYEIIVANTSPSMRIIFLFHGVGSLGQVFMVTYTCHFMMEESTNIITSIYSGSWSTLPMNDVGRSFRSSMKFTMIRSLKPCCLTAAGFFPLTLETFTSLLSSTFSYFTLMRQSLMRSDGE